MNGSLAIVGATGAVGRELCALIEERSPNIHKVRLLASPRSAGQKISVLGREIEVQPLGEDSFDGIGVAIFTAGGDISLKWAAFAVGTGAVVIDNSSAFRMDPTVPLVIPEINPQTIAENDGIIANPNCSTIIMNMAVWPLHKINPVRRIVVSTYQAASGAGAAAMEELRSQSEAVLNGEKPEPSVFPYPIAFNLFSHNTPIGDDGYNTEERKMIDETRKIFAEPKLAITATCIRVPVMRAHAESINLTFDKPITPKDIRKALHDAPGVELVDDAMTGLFPMPIDASGKDNVLIGRIRQDVSREDHRGIEMFVCGDQLRKGAALNAIQIMEILLK